jgi:hypothetical protein
VSNLSTWLSLTLFLAAALAVVLFGKGTAHGYALHSKFREMRAELADMRRRKDEAYAERAYVLALLATVLRDAGETSDVLHDAHKWRLFRGYDEHFKGWGNALYFEAPEGTGLGQMCWHFADDQAFLIDSLGLPSHPKGWDGTTTVQKYDAIRQYVSGPLDPG